MATTAQYASTAQCAQVQIATANTQRTGSGTIGTLIIGAANGTRVDDIYITATGTTTAGVVRLFVCDGSALPRLWQELLVTAVTPSTTQAVWSYSLLNQALLLKSGWYIAASTEKTETFNVIATRAGDF
jgi:hypothetical protein